MSDVYTPIDKTSNKGRKPQRSSRKGSLLLSDVYTPIDKTSAARIEQQLNTTKLMKTIQDAPSGKRVLVLGEFRCKRGQTKDTCIRIVEKALIEHALAEGYELVNQQGTKTPYDEIQFTGYSKAKAFTKKMMYVKRRRE